MKKSGKTYCDRCKKEIVKTEQSNVHDIISMGFHVGNCQVINWRKDICSDCADEFDKWYELVQ